MRWYVDERTGRVHVFPDPTITHEEKMYKQARKKKMKAIKKARRRNRK